MMKPTLTIAYVTSRREPHIEWFFESLDRQLSNGYSCKIIVVDRYHDTRGKYNLPGIKSLHSNKISVDHVAPKPNVWSGEFRLTTKDYFSVANARNTAAALCKTNWIAYVDDLSVLGPDWLKSAELAIAGNYIALGSYQKVRGLKVKDGKAVDFVTFEGGMDSRRLLVTEDLTQCAGGWMFGCSVVMPMSALHAINGWPEALCDSMGGEDYMTGIVLQNAGYTLKYDRRLFTYESEEDHHTEPPMVRWDPGTSPNDKSHRALDVAKCSTRFEQDFCGLSFGDLHWLLSSSAILQPKFPIPKNPLNEWYSGTPLWML